MSELVGKASELNLGAQRSRGCAKSRARSSSPLEHAVPEPKMDPEIVPVLESLDSTRSYATPGLEDDCEIKPKLESLDNTISYATPELEDDSEIKPKLESLNNTLSYATPELEDGSEIKSELEVVDKSLIYATPELKMDREIVPELESLDNTLKYATPELKTDREIEPESKLCEYALHIAAPKLKTDREIELESTLHEYAIDTAALELKTNREIEPDSKLHEYAIDIAAPGLKTDREIGHESESHESTLDTAAPKLALESQDSRTLTQYNTQNESTLDLAVTMRISVKTPDGETITLEAEAADNIGSVKAAIQDKAGIKPTQQYLFLSFPTKANSQLADGRTISDCNFQNEATMYCIRPALAIMACERVEDAEHFVETTTFKHNANIRILLDAWRTVQDMSFEDKCSICRSDIARRIRDLAT